MILKKILPRLILLMSLIGMSELTFAEAIWYPLPPEAYQFAKFYPEAQRLLFAFDYGHALVYEKLLLQRGKIKDPEKFERDMLKEILTILKNPPSVKVEERDIAPNYVYKFPKILDLFDWSHLLHQWVFDILASSENRGPAMIQRVQNVFDQYKANQRLAITDVCKTMQFMDGHFFSKAFRRTYPTFNLLIWSYHWFQIRLYEDLMLSTRSERDLAVKQTVDQFWEMISNLPDSAPFDMMPETAVEAPTFAKAFPNLPAAFDNNHMLHDIISDILVSDKVSDENLRSEGLRMAAMVMDPNAFRSNNCKSQQETP